MRKRGLSFLHTYTCVPINAKLVAVVALALIAAHRVHTVAGRHATQVLAIALVGVHALVLIVQSVAFRAAE